MQYTAVIAKYTCPAMYDSILVYIHRALDEREYLIIIFLFLIETICCYPSSEPSRQVQMRGNNMFLSRNNKDYP